MTGSLRLWLGCFRLGFLIGLSMGRLVMSHRVADDDIIAATCVGSGRKEANGNKQKKSLCNPLTTLAQRSHQNEWLR